MTKDLTTNVIESQIQHFAHSDHTKVTIKLDLSEIERGEGIWKINNSHLHDPEYDEEITRMWYSHQFRKTDNDNINSWWEEGKTRIKEIRLNFSKHKNREKRKHNARNKDMYNKINQEIKQLETFEAEGARIRSKAQWREDRETSSRYFCSLEKKQGVEKICE